MFHSKLNYGPLFSILNMSTCLNGSSGIRCYFLDGDRVWLQQNLQMTIVDLKSWLKIYHQLMLEPSDAIYLQTLKLDNVELQISILFRYMVDYK